MHPFSYFYFCNWDLMGPTASTDVRTGSAETSISSSVSEAPSFSTFRTTVKSLLKWWPASGSWRHELTRFSDAQCGRLQSPHQATTHNKTCDGFQWWKDSAETWQSRQKYFSKRLCAILRTGFKEALPSPLTWRWSHWQHALLNTC